MFMLIQEIAHIHYSIIVSISVETKYWKFTSQQQSQ